MRSQTNLDQVGRIWNWIGYRARQEPGNKVKPDIVLPHGILQETDLTLGEVATKFTHIAILQNCDLIVGPPLLSGNSNEKESKDLYSRVMQEFRNDILYLKKAIESKTIIIEDLPR